MSHDARHSGLTRVYDYHPKHHLCTCGRRVLNMAYAASGSVQARCIAALDAVPAVKLEPA